MSDLRKSKTFKYLLQTKHAQSLKSKVNSNLLKQYLNTIGSLNYFCNRLKRQGIPTLKVQLPGNI